jgi:hypothetical protein
MYLPIVEEVSMGGQTAIYLFDVFDTREFNDDLFIIGVD